MQNQWFCRMCLHFQWKSMFLLMGLPEELSLSMCCCLLSRCSVIVLPVRHGVPFKPSLRSRCVAVLLHAHPPHRHRVAHASSGNSSRHCAHGAPSLCSRCVAVFLSNSRSARGASRCSYKLTHASSGNSSHHCARGASRCCYKLTRPISTGWLRQCQANS